MSDHQKDLVHVIQVKTLSISEGFMQPPLLSPDLSQLLLIKPMNDLDWSRSEYSGPSSAVVLLEVGNRSTRQRDITPPGIQLARQVLAWDREQGIV